jgi:hypothetical protein
VPVEQGSGMIAQGGAERHRSLETVPSRMT